MSGYAVHNRALEGPPDLDRHPFIPVFKGGRLDLDAHDRIDRARTNQVPRAQYQQALELYDELVEKGDRYVEHARARDAESRYLLTVAHEHPHRAREMERLSDLLARAREHGVWQIGEKVVKADDGALVLNPALKCEWFNRAGLVKLCPDDAREEAMRVASIYVPRIESILKTGYEVRYAVATFPNSARGFLAADLRAIKARVRDWILYARTDGKIAKSTKDPKRIFYSLKGVLATVEAPLSARGDWNVHVNLILVFSDRPDYKALREAWGANIEFRTVKVGAAGAALRELVKYPLQAVASKSSKKTEHGRQRWDARRREWVDIGPPMIEWPTDAFLEWWDAHKRYRRTCSWGELFGSLDEPINPWLPMADVMGRMFLSPAGFRAEKPMFDTRQWDELAAQRAERELERDRRQRDWVAGLSDEQRELFDAQQAAQREQRELEETVSAWALDAWDRGEDPALDLDLILGNKSANSDDERGTGPPDSSPLPSLGGASDANGGQSGDE